MWHTQVLGVFNPLLKPPQEHAGLKNNQLRDALNFGALGTVLAK
jgi:ribosomal protein S16